MAAQRPTDRPQDLSSTEAGSYFLNCAMTNSDLLSIIRETDARWVIPTEDELYKAACYDPVLRVDGEYFRFPTASEEMPSNTLIDPDPGNKANFFDRDSTIGEPYWRREVGEFEDSPRPYGTFDQEGNVMEWTDPKGGPGPDLRSRSFFGCADGLGAMGVSLCRPMQELYHLPNVAHAHFTGHAFRAAVLNGVLYSVGFPTA